MANPEHNITLTSPVTDGAVLSALTLCLILSLLFLS